MEVSTFELLFKPQSPVPPAETVLQGYFLTISNLEQQEYRYRLTLNIHPPPEGIADREYRSLFEKAIFIIDSGGTNNQFGSVSGSSITDSDFRTNLITIPPMGTALVAILPDIFSGTPPPVDQPKFEVRGYAELTLPALIRFDFENGLRFVEQSNQPVKVLLTPQHRATFFSASNTITDQVQTSLPVASGQAKNHLQPEPGGPFGFEIPDLDVAISSQLIDALGENPDDALTGLIGSLLETFEREGENLDKLNKYFRNIGVPFVIDQSVAAR